MRLPPCPESARVLYVVLSLHLLVARLRGAEDSLSIKHQSYQEADGRIRVDSQYAMADAQLPAEIRLQLTGVIDTIAGATPTGELRLDLKDPVVLSEMRDRRKAWHAEVSRPVGPTLLSLGYDNSRESDYVSNAYSVNTATDFNAKNTTFLAGLAYADDDVKSVGSGSWRGKRATDAMVGITQLLNPDTTLNVSLTYGYSSGFLNDPYKLVMKTIEVLPGLFQRLTFAENRPDTREKRIVTATLNRSFTRLHGALEAGYRLYDDSFGVTAQSLTLTWFQRFAGERLLLVPSLRYHRQGAADFYHPNLDLTPILPETDPTVRYSSDYRLAQLETWTLGMKVVWFAIPDRLSLDAAVDHYRMRGLDSLTPASAFPTANNFMLGATLRW
ncbi:DUF3570 domain-containing protein [Nibricoccus sp. IMCC34717]|uniref:DUF3570 domain-containing protein n=1 Tax=Nibricoccus sp. IMCC34717 TaxID=3034021 RepID=UPI0038511EC4